MRKHSWGTVGGANGDTEQGRMYRCLRKSVGHEGSQQAALSAQTQHFTQNETAEEDVPDKGMR